jgi:RNA recognition motif-containing protein
MATNLFVGNLPYNVDDARLADLFSQAGAVASAKVIKDKYSGRSRGFGFVEMATDEETKKAIEMFNGKDVDGRALVVNEARPPKAQ